MVPEATGNTAAIERLFRPFVTRVVIANPRVVRTSVATARKLAVLIWHILAQGEEYAFAHPACQAMKLRNVALKADAAREYGKAGPGRD